MADEETIINDCQYLGEHNLFYISEDTNIKKPKLHFGCEIKRLSQQSNDCMFPDYIKNPGCCVMYTSGGEKKVSITEDELKKYQIENIQTKRYKGKPMPDIFRELSK